jgi:hypothetical protein
MVLIGLLLAAPANASWNANGGGTGYSKAQSLPTVGAPSASVSGRQVSVSWSAPGGGPALDGYVVKRYDGSNVLQSIGAACSGTITGLSCVESAVPPGNWRYTVTSKRQNWLGNESANSSTVTVDPPGLSLSSPTVNSFPTTLTGQITSFVGGQNVTYRLDNPTSGPILSGSITPSTVPANGTASASVTIPAGTSNGAHTVYAIGNGGDQASAAITVDAPEVTASAIAKSAGGRSGFIKQGGTYRVYANVSGTGGPPAGLASLTANVSNITTGQTAVAMSFGTFTVGGQTYNYRSAQLTANASLSAGSKSYSVKLTDSGGTVDSSNFTVTVDNTKPTASAVETTNAGITGKAELGDGIILTYSEPIEEISVLAGWDGSATNVVVRLNHGATDSVQIWNATNTAQLPLGTINLAATDYVTTSRTFGATGTPSTMTQSGSTVNLTLGTPSGATSTAVNPSAMVWTPSASATDAAGNTAATTARTEAGPADKNF